MTFKGPIKAISSVGGLYTALIVLIIIALSTKTQQAYQINICKNIKLSKKYQNIEIKDIEIELKDRLSTLQLFKIYDVVH